jgi:hypothetical protein
MPGKVKAGWMANAACKDEDTTLFMSHMPEDIEAAKAICATCSVKVPCEKAYKDVDCVAGGKTLLERLNEKWKRIDG